LTYWKLIKVFLLAANHLQRLIYCNVINSNTSKSKVKLKIHSPHFMQMKSER
jgi:hypothetical protein